MSGGSWNYFYCWETDKLFSNETIIFEMANRLIKEGYKDAGQETLMMALDVQRTRVYLETIQSRLENVWRAIEWKDSQDSGDDAIKNAIEKYRTNKTKGLNDGD